MDISVLVPIYGVENYIERCLRSLFTQTKVDGVEFILVNDCTKDNSMVVAQRVIDEYPNLNIRIINHEKNRGLAAARQTGLDAASGEYVQFIDSDDYVVSTMLEEMFCKAKSENADMVICDYIRKKADSETYVKSGYVSDHKKNIEQLLSGGIYPILWAKLVRRSFFLKNKITFEEGLNYGEDLLCTIKLLVFDPKISNIANAFYFYDISRENSYTRDNSSKNILNLLDTTIAVDRFLRKKDDTNFYDQIRCNKRLLKFSSLNLALQNNEDVSEVLRRSPEVDKDIFTELKLPITRKICLFLAVKGWVRTAKFITKVLDLFHQMKNACKSFRILYKK